MTLHGRLGPDRRENISALEAAAMLRGRQPVELSDLSTSHLELFLNQGLEWVEPDDTEAFTQLDAIAAILQARQEPAE